MTRPRRCGTLSRTSVSPGRFWGSKLLCPPCAALEAGPSSTWNRASTRSGGGSPAYGASKAGIVGLTTQLAAKSYASDGIRCNMVSPGHVDTPFIRQDNAHSPNDWPTTIDNPDNYQRRLDATPLGRLQIPEDIAKAFLFLASDGASMITRVNLKVDGGAGI